MEDASAVTVPREVLTAAMQQMQAVYELAWPLNPFEFGQAQGRLKNALIDLQEAVKFAEMA